MRTGGPVCVWCGGGEGVSVGGVGWVGGVGGGLGVGWVGFVGWCGVGCRLCGVVGVGCGCWFVWG